MFITVCLNPALDKTLVLDSLNVDGVNRVAATRTDAGGKSINVSKMLRVLGADTVATGIIGGSSGMFIQKQLDAAGVRHDFVVRNEPTRTNLKIIDSLRHTTTELNEAGVAVTEDLLNMVWEKLDQMAGEGDYVIISGSNPPGMADDVLASWIRKLKAKGVLVALDTVGNPMKLGIRECPHVIKPNLAELSEICDEPLHYIRDVLGVGRQIVYNGVGIVVASMGADGALFITRDQILRCTGLRVPVCSTVGSGDAMLAAFLYHLDQGSTLEEAAKWSVATGTANVMCDGSQTPTLEQITAFVEQIQVEQLL